MGSSDVISAGGSLESAGQSGETQAVELKQDLGLFSAVTIVAGSMIGSGIFIVSADIARQVGSAGMLLAIWLFTGLITVMAAFSYGKLAAHMPKAGGQYVFLKEAWGDLPGFLYGWALFTVIQTGTIAAVAVAFGKFLGVLVPEVSSQVVIPITESFGFSNQQLIAVALLLGMTAFNCTGVKNGAMLQNIFTSLKVLALLGLITLGFVMGSQLWGAGAQPVAWDWSIPSDLVGERSVWAIFAAATVGALFSSDAWNNVTFIGGEIKNPRQNLPRALVLGTGLVVLLYFVVNVSYLNVLTLPQIQAAPEDRVATAVMNAILGPEGAIIMALIILVSTFGCLNGMILAGARVLYAMAKDRFLFPQFAVLNPKTQTPNFALWVQGIWASLLALSGQYGQLLDYVVFTALVFYILTILGLFKLARRMPEAVQMSRPTDYIIPVLYLVGVSYVSLYLLIDPAKCVTSLIGLGLTAIGAVVFWIWQAAQKSPSNQAA
jgi:APA family basic amino acid/polyamine antiporter